MVPPAVTGIIDEAVGATLVASKTVGNTVALEVTGVTVTDGLLDPVGNVQADKFGRKWFAGTVTVEIAKKRGGRQRLILLPTQHLFPETLWSIGELEQGQ